MNSGYDSDEEIPTNDISTALQNPDILLAHLNVGGQSLSAIEFIKVDEDTPGFNAWNDVDNSLTIVGEQRHNNEEDDDMPNETPLKVIKTMDMVRRLHLLAATQQPKLHSLICVSVRKRVVKIFRDVCLSQPDFVRIPDICSRLLRRIHDEESIRKLVLETFQQLWFSPTRNNYEVRQRVQTIIDVLIDAQKQNNTWLENLVKEFLQINDKQSNDDKARIREQRKDVLNAIKDIINELVESILKIESANDQVSSNKMVATFIALYALGKANPEHVLPHVSTIVEYLNIKCTSYNDNAIVQYVAKILEFTVPLMKSASSSIIYSLEGSLTKLLLVSGQLVIHSSIACLAAAIRLSKNVSLVKDVLIRYHSFIIECQEKIIEKPKEECKGSAQLARSIYILGVLCKYFDVERSEYDDLQFSVDDIFQLFMFFIERNDSVVKLKSVVGLGFFLQRYGHYLVEDAVRQLYHTYLLDRRPIAAQLRCQVLINLEEYFRDCIRRMAEQDVDYLNIPTTTNTHHDENSNDTHGITGANLKDTADVHSEMASSIAQCYLRIVLDTYLSEDEIIRQCVRKVVTCILEQGLVHPVQFIPFLIAMTTDRDINIQQSAEQNLQDLDKTNPGIIQTKVMQGFKMSYQLQKLLTMQNAKQSDPQADIIRGKICSVLIGDKTFWFINQRTKKESNIPAV
ncbi:unnamed protein product [Rotaria magnacalcarata]|uniref:Nipped-B protein n=1 Tax=Rotaria magnacalcarata TaxID=392030 RepID=A0A8S2L906_9BILA|nr:unnamed protein product [Rotaria magnacalcarata]